MPPSTGCGIIPARLAVLHRRSFPVAPLSLSADRRMAKLGFGIVDCGMIAQFHARAIADLKGAHLTAAYSTNPENAKRIVELSPR